LLYSDISFDPAIQTILFLCLAFLLVSLEDILQGILPFSGLLAVMAAGIAFQRNQPEKAGQLAKTFNTLWTAAEILLFVLVGATVNIQYAFSAGLTALVLIFGILCFRIIGVYVSLWGTSFSTKEKVFCMIAYIPKATVQPAIGGLPLAMGLSNGDLILTVAVCAGL